MENSQEPKAPLSQRASSTDTKVESTQQEFNAPERRVKPPPPPQTGVRAFVDRNVGMIMKILGVV